MQFNVTATEREYFKTRWQTLQTEARANLTTRQLTQKLEPFLDIFFTLTRSYEAIAANPPYMGQKSMNNELSKYLNEKYPVSKADLMTVFMEVIPALTVKDGLFSLINLPSWLFLSSFEKLRKDYLKNFHVESLIHMGRGIFGIDFGSVAFTIKKKFIKNGIGNYFRLHERNFQHIYYADIEKLFLYSNGKPDYKYDFTLYRDEDGTTVIPVDGTKTGLKLFYPNIHQSNFSNLPGSPIAYWVSENMISNFKYDPINSFSFSSPGVRTGRDSIFIRDWTEINWNETRLNATEYNDIRSETIKWYPITRGGNFRKWYGNFEWVINLQNEAKSIKEICPDYRFRESAYYFKEGITWTMISSTKPSFRKVPVGVLFGNGGPVMFTKDDLSVIGMLNTKVAYAILLLLNPTLNYTKTDVIPI